MFDWINDFFAGLIDIVVTFVEWLLTLPVKLINYLIDLWYWIREETLNGLKNLLWDSFQALVSLSPWEFTVDEQLLNSIYVNANIFFPVDDLVAMGIFLLETWVCVRVARYSVFLALLLFHPRKPNVQMLSSGGE